MRSHPAKNGTVQAGEVTVEIEYSGLIDIGRSRLSLAGPGGERDLSLDNTVGPNVLKAAAGSLGPGVYTLRWYVLSSDGHDPRHHSISRSGALSGCRCTSICSTIWR